MKGFLIEYQPKYSVLSRKYILCDRVEDVPEKLVLKDKDYRMSYPTKISEIPLEQIPVKELSVAELMQVVSIASKS